MKVVELMESPLSLTDLLELAQRELLVLRRVTPPQEFILAPIDELAVEVEMLRQNQEFMAYLEELFQQPATWSLAEVEQELGI